MAGVTLLAFGFYATMQVLLYGCISPMPPVVFTCYAGLHPLLVPPLLLAGAAILLVGSLYDREVFRGTALTPPPGLESVVLGAGVLEFGSLFVYSGASGWDPVSMETVILLLAGAFLVIHGVSCWWRNRRAGAEALADGGRAVGPYSRPNVPSPRPSDRRPTPGLFLPFGVAMAAFGLLVVTEWFASVPRMCGSLPLYACTYLGFDPVLGVWATLLGAGLILASLLYDTGPHWTDARAAATGVLALGLGSGLFGLIPTLFIGFTLSMGFLDAVYLVIVLLASGVLWVIGIFLVS